MAAALATSSAAPAAWHQATSAHFNIYADENPVKLRAYAERLERFDQAMRRLRNLSDGPLSPGNKLNVYVVSDTNAVARLAKEQNVAGFYVPRASGSVAFVPRRSGDNGRFDLDAQTIFFHEYTHHLMLANDNGVLPAWYVEGFAEFHATARIADDGAVVFGHPPNYRGYGLLGNGRKIAFDDMLAGAYNKPTEEELDSLYGRGWLVLHYLTFEPSRRGQLTKYNAAINDGKPGREAANLAFGDLKLLSRELDKYVMQKRIASVTVAAERLTVGPIEVRPLPRGQAAFMKVRMQSTRGVDEKSARALVGDARRAAAPYPTDPAVQAQLAEVEYDAKNWKEANAAADRALAADPRNVHALIYKGRIAVAGAVAAKATDAAIWRDARRWFVDAAKIDQEDPYPKVLYYSSFAAAGAKPTRNAVDALTFASELVPQDQSLRVQMAYQHLVDGKLAAARTALGPVAYNPHGGTRRDWASKIIVRLAANDAKGALAFWSEHPPEAETD